MTLDISDSLTRYHGQGVEFEYPDIWELIEEVVDRDVLVTVSADGSCFWALRILPECPRADEVIDACVDALLDEYEDAEVWKSTGALAALSATCREVEFSCFELLNTVSFCCVRSSEMTLLVWWQATDHELAVIRPLFERMSQSVRILSLGER